MKKTLTLALAYTLILPTMLGLARVNLATANPYGYTFLPAITIASDGNISPPTDYIKRSGNTYTLTADLLDCPIAIEGCSNIVFDGAGHTINLTRGDNPTVNVGSVTNVTVKNLTAYSPTMRSISLAYSSNCIITNVKTNHDVRIFGDYNIVTLSDISLDMWSGHNNLIIENVIHNVYLASYCSSNTFSQNNFLSDKIPERITHTAHFWDNGSVGNYWSDYLTKYPNASEIGNSGIGDVPYFIDEDNIDRFPLIHPWGSPELVVLGIDNNTYLSYPLNFTVNKPMQWMGYSLDGKVNVTITGNGTIKGLPGGFHNLTVYAIDVYGVGGASKTVYFEIVDPLPAVFIAGVSAASITGVAAGLLYNRRKRRR
jgi:hypothetical protein